jgi:nitrile hydratase
MSDDHGHHHPRPTSGVELRARALEALLAERGLVSTDAIDAVVEMYENDVGPRTAPRSSLTPGWTTRTGTDC